MSISKAVLIGINYKYGEVSPLHGCHNDVALAQEVLGRKYGFAQPPKVFVDKRNKQGHDDQPTKAHIIAALQWLVEGAKDGDVLYFHFSGHGSQVLSKIQTSPDGSDIDECLVPVDTVDDNGLIRDKDIYSIIKVLEGRPLVNLTMVFDACHSGGGSRSPFKPKPTSPDYQEPRYYQLLDDLPIIDKAVGSTDSAFRRLQRSTKEETEPLACVLIAGCRSWQLSYDSRIGGRNNGVLSYFMFKHLNSDRPRHDWQNQRLINEVSTDLKKHGFGVQEPQVDALPWRRTLPFLQSYSPANLAHPLRLSSSREL